MKNKKYEGSIDNENKMPFTSEKLDEETNTEGKKGAGRTLEVEDRIIQIHDK